MFELILVNERGIALIDDEDKDRVSKHRWYLHNHGYAVSSGGKRLLHRFILNAPKGSIVDHINGNKLDNQKGNLRLVDHSLNAFHRHQKDVRSASGIPGVQQRGDRWAVYLFHLGKRHYIGMAGSKLEAAEKRAKAEIKHFGEISPVTLNVLGGQNHF